MTTIKECCISFLNQWGQNTVRPVLTLELICSSCEQRWRLKKSKILDSSNLPFISWTKVKKVAVRSDPE